MVSSGTAPKVPVTTAAAATTTSSTTNDDSDYDSDTSEFPTVREIFSKAEKQFRATKQFEAATSEQPAGSPGEHITSPVQLSMTGCVLIQLPRQADHTGWRRVR